MANSQTYIEGLNPGGAQLTTLDNIQGAGLKLPVPTSNFINIRAPGKIERLFTTPGNSTTLYNKNKPTDQYLKGPLASQMFVYKSIEQGQKNKIRTPIQASIQDSNRVRKFLGSSAGTKFILKQLVLQGFQPFDETKVYNPASPIIAAFRLASFGAIDRPTRHLDTSNIVGGLLGASGLGSIVRTVGGLFGGGGPPVPAPPRSSVASGASSGFGIATFTSMLGGADKSDKVVTPLARPDVRDLLRGQTATDAYNAPRYSKLVGGGGGSFFGRLLGGVGKFLQNNTLLGGIIPPKQPWSATYRADEQTYDLYLNAGKLFDPNQTGIGGGGILSGVLNSIGFGKKANYSQAVTQRFYNKSKNKPNFNRSIVVARKNRYTSTVESTDETAYKTIDQNSQIITKKVSSPDDVLTYTSLINVTDDGDLEVSDQLLNYKTLTEKTKNFSDAFSDKEDQVVKNIIENLNRSINNIVGNDNDNKYNINNDNKLNSVYVQQFGKKIGGNTKIKDGIGFDYLTNIKSTNVSSEDLTYEGRWSSDKIQYKQQTRMGKRIEPTNDVDYVNTLTVLNKSDFNKYYGSESEYSQYGPDIVKFYFYDIVNEKYVPFRATVKGITDSNTANWETVEYLGRPDKLYYYKGFERQVNFNFTVNAHSIKELMPMWQRINYLTTLTQPSNYTLQQNGGFMIPPMVQLTLGDFFKNHFVVITSCNVTIPDDASWETLPEELAIKEGGGIEWFYGPDKAFKWENNKVNYLTNAKGPLSPNARSKGRYAQFPRTAEIQLNMNILSKDRPKTGRGIWGDAIVEQISVDKLDAESGATTFNVGGTSYDIISLGATSVDTTNKDQTNLENNTFSTNIRTDNDLIGKR